MELGMEEDARPAKESGSTGQVQESDKTTGKPGDISEENSRITKSQPDDLQCNSEQKKTGDDRKKDSGKASDKNVLRKIKSLWQTIKELPGIISRQFRKIRRSLQNAKSFAERIHELFADELNQYAVKKIGEAIAVSAWAFPVPEDVHKHDVFPVRSGMDGTGTRNF